MKRRIRWALGVVLILSVTLCMMCGSAFADDTMIVDSGTCGENLTWTLDEAGTLTVSGAGKMTDWQDYIYTPWYKHQTSIKNVIITDGVTSIGQSAFASCGRFKNISLPDSISSIGIEAFKNCKLTSIFIPSNVTSIGGNAFGSCHDMSSIVVADDNNSFASEDGVLFNKTKTKLLKYPNGKQGDSYTVPTEVNEIGSSAFQWCNLKNVVLPEGLTRIGSEAFILSHKITSINIPDNVISIESQAFRSCDSLQNISIPDGITSIKEWTFCGCDSLTSIVIPSSVEKIGAYAFSGCYGLTQIYFNGDVPSIYDNFSSACSFKSVVATAYYPIGNKTWTDSVKRNYGGILTWTPWHPGAMASNYNDTIIDRVKEYTSDEMYNQLMEVMNENCGHEERFRKMNSLFATYGFAHAREGIKFLSNTNNKRFAYLMMTNDDTYCANNYVDWLDSGPSLLKRGVLLSSDLIFNNEIKEYLSVTNYVEGDFPHINKYKTMLYEFMDATSESIEIQSNVKLMSDLAEDVSDIYKEEANEMVSKMNNCKTIGEVDECWKYAKNHGILTNMSDRVDAQGDRIFSFKLDESSGFAQYQKALGIATTVISVSDMSITNIRDLISLDSKLAVYAQYKRFLEEISEDRFLPWEMRCAAGKILVELKDGYGAKVQDIAFDIIEETKFNDHILDMILNKFGVSSIKEWLAIIEIDAFFINQIANVGNMVKNEAYVEGYNYLARSYVNRLEESKTAFLNQPNEANAWNFYYNYNILYRLRYKGEQAYLSMTKVDGLAGKLSDFGFKAKKELVDNTLKLLDERCKFTFDGASNIPESCQFATKAIVKCPVDVDVVASDGTVMATLKDGQESDITNEYGRFAVLYDYYSEDYSKIICLNEEDDFTIKATGTNKGLVNMELASVKQADTVYTVNNIPVQKGKEISASMNQIVNNQTVTVYEPNVAEGTDYEVQVSDGNVVSPETMTLNNEQIELDVGETELITVDFAPSNTTNQGVIWQSSDPDVVRVVDGRVEGVAEGTATVNCISQADSELFSSCEVTVTAPECGAKVSSASLTLEGQIGVNFYLELNDEMVDSDKMVRFTFNGKSTDLPITAEHATVLNKQSVYKFTFAVAAKEMNDTIVLQIVDADGNIRPLVNAKDVNVSNGYQYSVAKYCNLVKTYGDDRIKSLTAVMMNYGAYTQDYFQYATSEGKSDDLRADMDSVTMETLMPYKAVQSDSRVSGINYYATSLLLESETTIRHYFTLDEGEDISDYSITCGDDTLTPVKKSGRYYVDITKIAAKDLDTAYTVTVAKGDETYSITYYALTYGYSVLKNSQETTLLDMVKALYLYNNAANTYFKDN